MFTDFKHYENPTNGISIDYPSDWNMKDFGESVELVSHTKKPWIEVNTRPTENKSLDEEVHELNKEYRGEISPINMATNSRYLINKHGVDNVLFMKDDTIYIITLHGFTMKYTSAMKIIQTFKIV